MSIISDSIAKIGVSYGPSAMASTGLFNSPKPEGRSGYWRLFYIQLQEEALKPKVQPVKTENPPKLQVVENADGSASVVYPEIKSKSKPKRAAEVKREDIPRLPPVPVQKEPDVVTHYLEESWKITLEIRSMYSSFQQSMIKYSHARSNEDEEDIEFLLLHV